MVVHARNSARRNKTQTSRATRNGQAQIIQGA
jgi:hypothetical protein